MDKQVNASSRFIIVVEQWRWDLRVKLPLAATKKLAPQVSCQLHTLFTTTHFNPSSVVTQTERWTDLCELTNLFKLIMITNIAHPECNLQTLSSSRLQIVTIRRRRLAIGDQLNNDHLWTQPTMMNLIERRPTIGSQQVRVLWFLIPFTDWRADELSWPIKWWPMMELTFASWTPFKLSCN